MTTRARFSYNSTANNRVSNVQRWRHRRPAVSRPGVMAVASSTVTALRTETCTPASSCWTESRWPKKSGISVQCRGRQQSMFYRTDQMGWVEVHAYHKTWPEFTSYTISYRSGEKACRRAIQKLCKESKWYYTILFPPKDHLRLLQFFTRKSRHCIRCCCSLSSFGLRRALTVDGRRLPVRRAVRRPFHRPIGCCTFAKTTRWFITVSSWRHLDDGIFWILNESLNRWSSWSPTTAARG